MKFYTDSYTKYKAREWQNRLLQRRCYHPEVTIQKSRSPELFLNNFKNLFKRTRIILTKLIVLFFKCRVAGKEKMEKTGFRQIKTVMTLKSGDRIHGYAESKQVR